MTLLTTGDYPAIRAVIDVGITPSDLPDNIIGLDIYLGAADREVKELDQAWATRTGDELLQLKAAAVYLTAARLVWAVVRITSLSVQARDLSYQKATFDPAEREAQLRALGLAQITEITDEIPAGKHINNSTSVRIVHVWQ